MKTIIFSDYTLRLAQEKRSHALLFREKVAIAKAIESLGVGAIDLPKITSPREDTIINKTISSTLTDTTVVLPAGDSREEIEQAWESIKGAAHPCLEIALPVSTVQMEYIYRLKNSGMIEKISSLCAAASELCPYVTFTALDATRAEPAFLIEACKAAVDAGASTLVLCDDAGTCLPGEWAQIIKNVKNEVKATILVKTNDRLGLAAACALEALSAGADGLKVCIKDSEALTIEKAAALLAARGEDLGFSSSILHTGMHTDIESLLKSLERSSYTETPAQSGETALFLDAQSTPEQIRESALALGYDLNEKDVGKVKESLEIICRKKSSVGRKEFEAIIASSAMQVPSTYHLDCYTATSGNMTLSVSQVTLMRDGEKISGVAAGDGPIDAAFRALEDCIGHHYELDDFQIQSVTEGREALGSALVRLRHAGKLYSGNGLSTDIVGASIRAYINALNKIVYEE